MKLRTFEASVPLSKLRIIYRLSDNSYRKERFDFVSNELCLKNFLDVFRPALDATWVIADSVSDQTWEYVEALPVQAVRTEFGNGAASFRHGVVGVARPNFSSDDFVYFVEDDYIHRSGALVALLEGAALADYVTLYDHADKYLSREAGGNAALRFGGELTRLARSPSAHWRTTNSTTMTFAASMATLETDWEIWDRHTSTRYPDDYRAFLALARAGRSLINPVPGFSTHGEPLWASPGVDWAEVAQRYGPH